MKVLQVTAAYKPAYIYGGPTMSVAKLSEELVNAGVLVNVFTTTANGTAELAVVKNEQVLVDGVQVSYFSRLTKDHSHLSPRLLFQLWKEVRNFDVLHVHAWWNLVSVLSCFIALSRNVPVVISPRGTLSAYSFSCNHTVIKKWLHQLIGKRLLNRCYFHTTSEREQRAVANLLQTRGMFTIHNFVSLADGPVLPITPDPQVLNLLFFSRIDKKKGLGLLFEALSQVSFPYRLTIAGNGEDHYLKELQELSKGYQLEAQLHWAGFIEEDKFALLAAHDLLVLPSYDENFGNVVIESLSVGTAVLLTENVGLAQYTEDNQLGWVCETSVSSLRQELNKIAKDPEKLAAIRHGAPARIREDFNESHQVKKYIDMYQSIIAIG